MTKFFDLKAGIGVFSQPPEYTEPDQLLEIMDSLSIEKALVYQSLSREISPVKGNSLLLQKIKEFPRLVPSWAILPPESGDIPDFEEYIYRGLEEGVRVFWVFPSIYRVPLSEFVRSGTFALAEKCKVPVVIEPTARIWEADSGDWPSLRLLCEKHPELPIIFSEFRTRYHIRMVLQFLTEFPNFYFDVGCCWNYMVIEKLVEKTEGERLVLGTNMPLLDPTQSMGMILLSKISKEEKEKISFGNLSKLIEEVEIG